MPLHDLLKDALTTALDHITMAGDKAVKVPLGNPLTAVIEPLPVCGRDGVPNETSLPCRFAVGVINLAHKLGQDATRGTDIGLGELFISRQVEQEVALDHSLGGLMVEDELLVGVGGNVFVVELLVELV